MRIETQRKMFFVFFCINFLNTFVLFYILGSELGKLINFAIILIFYNSYVSNLLLGGPQQRLFSGIVIKYFFAIGELLLLGLALSIRTWRTLNAVLAIVPIPFIFFYL